MNEVIWKLTDEEAEEIKDLFERRVALENLSKIVDPDNQKMYDKLVSDYGKALLSFNSWWEDMGKKYEWKAGEWGVNFETNEVYVINS